MRFFEFDVQEVGRTFADQGWVHVRSGARAELVQYVEEVVERAEREAALSGRGIHGQKDQFVLDFPPEVDLGAELFDVIAGVGGLRRESMTLSERHIKAYQSDAAEYPHAHKDRFASQVAVGVSVRVPPGSHLVLFPETDRSVNPFLSTGYRDSLEPDALPEVVLRGAPEIEIHDEPGDVVIFPGSAMWHLRRKGAGTVNLYLKFNDFDADPLGEDPSSAERRETTRRNLDGDWSGRVPVLSRRFDSVVHRRRREGWEESLAADVWGQPPVPLSDAEAEMLLRIDGSERAGSFDRAAVERLARRGVIDLL